MHLRVVAVACVLFVFVLVLPGCGGGSSTTPEVLPPAITAHPSNITVNAGQPATFTVTANGSSPLAYQWQKNDSAISGATSASYTTPATTSADDGSTFKVVVSNAAGSATSDSATLTVNIPQNVSVSVTPKRAAVVITAQSQQFIATVSGDTQNLGVTWSVDGTGSGNATVGSISSSGLYTPPSSGGYTSLLPPAPQILARAHPPPSPSQIFPVFSPIATTLRAMEPTPRSSLSLPRA